MDPSISPRRTAIPFVPFVLAIVAVIAVKAAAILAYAPAALGDNAAFIAAAEQILSGTRWLSDPGLDAGALPPTLWRPIGYSLVIAGAKAAFGAMWPYAMCTLQAALSLAAGLLLMRLCTAAGLSFGMTLAVFLLYEGSVPLSTDALIMEDALTGALGFFALYLLLRPIVAGRIPPLGGFVAAGAVAALSFLIRDVYHFVMPVVGGCVLLVLARTIGWARAALYAGALVVPVFLTNAGLQAWNEYRTGAAVTTTSGQTAYIYGVLRAAQHDPAIIDGPGKLAAVLRETNTTFDYVDTARANQVLFSREGMNAVMQLRAAQTLFWSLLATHPWPFVEAAFQRVRFVQQASLFASPLTRVDDLQWWAGGATEEGYRVGWRADALPFLQSRNLADLTLSVALQLGVRRLCQLAGVVLFVVFLVGTPLTWLLLRRRLDGAANAALVAWALYGLWVLLYIPVSFEVRYLSPVIGPALFATALVATNARSLAAAFVTRPSFARKAAKS